LVSERPEDGEAQDGAGAVRDVDVVQLVADELLDWLGDANRRHDQQRRYTQPHAPTTLGGVTTWRRGAVVSGVRRTNEVNARRARLLPGWVTVFGRVYHLDM